MSSFNEIGAYDINFQQYSQARFWAGLHTMSGLKKIESSSIVVLHHEGNYTFTVIDHDSISFLLFLF